MPDLQVAIISIISALVLYTIAVWSEKLSSRLKWWHLGFFYLGFIADTTGTGFMTLLAHGFHLKMHTLTGLIALIIMFVHTLWATWVLIRQNESALKVFHKYSIAAWLIWLIPFISGMVVSIPK